MVKHQYWRIKGRRIYSIREASETLGVHSRTIQNWLKDGLQVIDPNIRPYLIEGSVLKAFLKNRSTHRKVKLSPYEFYCVHCRRATQSHPVALTYKKTDKRLGKSGVRQYIVQGLCCRCETKVNRFSSETKIEALREFYEDAQSTTQFEEVKTRLIRRVAPNVYADLEGECEDE